MIPTTFIILYKENIKIKRRKNIQKFETILAQPSE